MKNIWKVIGVLVLLGMGLVFISMAGAVISVFQQTNLQAKGDSVLVLDLEGVILDGKSFLKQLRRYSKDEKVKAVVVRINSPGGVVGPSQEIYAELNRVREELEKPVVASCNGMAASGGYYVALGADKIVTNPGTLMGSIGVIMEFANMEKLYQWAKVDRFAIKTGALKDTGASYRAMEEGERSYLQGLVDEVLVQFKGAIQKSRRLQPRVVDTYSDGRVFTGQWAVDNGFADQVGTLADAVRLASEMAGVEDLEIFAPTKRPSNIFEFLQDMEGRLNVKMAAMETLFPVQLFGQPLFLLPSYFGATR